MKKYNKQLAGQSIFETPQQKVLLSNGTASLPCFFRQVTYNALLFVADKPALYAELKHSGLKPALFWLGRPVVAIGCIRYMESDLGAYDEVITAVPVVPVSDNSLPLLNWANLLAPTHRKRVGQYILDIPVTSERSCTAGNELWGYPKTVAPITHEFRQHTIRTTVHDADTGELVVRVAGSFAKGVPALPVPLLTYSFRNKQLLRTEVAVRGRTWLHLRPGIRLSAGNIQHPMAARLHRLGLHNARALALLRTPHFQSVFFAGKIVRA